MHCKAHSEYYYCHRVVACSVGGEAVLTSVFVAAVAGTTVWYTVTSQGLGDTVARQWVTQQLGRVYAVLATFTVELWARRYTHRETYRVYAVRTRHLYSKTPGHGATRTEKRP